MPRFLLCIAVLSLIGCAGHRSYKEVNAPPIPTDIGWSTPLVGTALDPEPETTPAEPGRPASAWETVFPYEDGHAVQVDVAINRLLTFQLAQDEEPVTVVAGDRSKLPEDDPEAPWVVKLGERGSKYPLVHVTVSRPGLRTTMNIPTTKRLYIVDLRSVAQNKTRLVRWTYADEPKAVVAQKPRAWPDPRSPQSYHVGYAITPSDPPPVWTPRHVVDTGGKTYILFPPNLSVMAAPMIRLIGPNGPEVTNAHLVDSVLRIDHLINHAELRLGSGKTAETVRIIRGPAVTIHCPGDLQCPQWPPTPERPGMALRRR
jgi:type IV secretion system protein TrbG